MRALRALGLALVAVASAALAPAARADCSAAPLDPFCGSRVMVSAVSGNTAVLSEEIKGIEDDPTQTIGPAHTTRLPDPTDPYGQGNLSDERAAAEIDFGLGVFATEAGTLSGAVDYGASLDANANSRVAFDEYLSVGSASLAPGTVVTLRLRYRVAFGAAQLHDLPPAALNYTTQWARSDIQLYTTLGSNWVPHRWLESGDGTVIMQGIFNDPTQVGEMTAQATIGQTKRLTLELRSETTSKASVYSSPQFPNASTAATAALVFGIEADEPGVTITSPFFGAVPDFSGVTAANALANVLPVPVGAPVTVPESSTLGSELAACAVLLATARRYAASHASA